MKFRSILATFASTLLVVSTLLALTACNTVEGAGEDVEDLGEGVQDVAD